LKNGVVLLPSSLTAGKNEVVVGVATLWRVSELQSPETSRK